MKPQLWLKPTRLCSVSDQWGNLLQSPGLVYCNLVVVCDFKLVMCTCLMTYAVWLPYLVLYCFESKLYVYTNK